MGTLSSNYEFIELDRAFRTLSAHDNESDSVDISQFFVGEHLRWPDLIKEYRLIILSEAGSGKTAEILNRANRLKDKGKPAFFLRLENIRNDFEDAFEVGGYAGFQEWLASGEEGWLFLDSIDEARLKDPRDFAFAIRKLGKEIDMAKDRAHIVITGRTPAWRPKTDLDHCEKHLPYTPPSVSARNSRVEDDGAEQGAQIEIESRDGNDSVFKVVALDDLVRAQVEVYVKERGIEDSQAFLDAVERADAWSFTSRPQDLEELIGFWLDSGQIGTRLGLIRNSINRRLTERDQDRADIQPLSLERARQGAKLLAAATTLTEEPTIRIPGGAGGSTGITVQSVLSEWNEKDESILLSRPIFDEAIYGTVRFHHRSVREYLAAEWFSELLRRETSRRSIEGLFFRNQYGLDIVVPALRPVLPWLAILDEKIGERVRQIAPKIFFEGGDPGRLPPEIRRDILHKVCEQMTDAVSSGPLYDHMAAQRFVDSDLSDDIRILIQQYSDNENLIAFLFGMVWLGQLQDALPEAMEVALTPTAGYFSRAMAFRAVDAIGSYEDKKHVRQSFLAEASELKREWLSDLLERLEPTEEGIAWLLSCLEKCEPKEPFSADSLTDRVTTFVVSTDINLLPLLVRGLNKLLDRPPVIERPYCQISERFQWLMEPASRAVEQLVFARRPAALEADALAILHKLSAARHYIRNDLGKIETRISNLVSGWNELNRALFWFEVQRSRETRDRKRGERLTDIRHVSLFGSFWRFDEDDFEYLAGQILNQSLSDDGLVALSGAFDVYRMANRPRKWREKLKRLVADNAELSERLGAYLRPPAQSETARRYRRQEAAWRRRAEARRKKEEKYHADWKEYFKNNLDEAKAQLCDKPEVITGPLYYLFQQNRNELATTGRWTEYNWRELIAEYGERVAYFYRDSVVSFWRCYEPQLRSEGAPLNTVPYEVVIGLVGLEIEAVETERWPSGLSPEEVERACRYASFELNGFPTWFPKLFEMYPEIVGDFLMREVSYELSIEKPEVETHYVISDLSWSGQWAWEWLAPKIYDLLKREPANLSNLDKLLKIAQGSDLPGELIERLASRKCRTLGKPDHAARWFAVWAGVNPEAAIASLKARIEKIADLQKRTFFAMIFITHLLGERISGASATRDAFKTPKYLKTLYFLMHEYIREKEDINRIGMGAYTPDLRDHAQDARNSLFSLLSQIPGKESFSALMEIAEAHPEEGARPWILFQARQRAERDGDIEPWSPDQIRDFNEKLERTPSNHDQLADLAVLRLRDLKDDLEHGDTSVAAILQSVTRETDMRQYIGRELREKAAGRYLIPQEEELADAKKPDLRFHGMGFDGPVPVELKLADNLTGPKLTERLKVQLCGDYLRDNRSTRGIFLLVYRGQKRSWLVPGSGRVDFADLPIALEDFWRGISSDFPGIDEIKVIGIDLTKRR